MGEFVEVDMTFLKSCKLSYVWILLKLDTRKGLKEDIEIEHSSSSYIKPLDYEGVPFRCRRWHKIGHLVVAFPQPFKQSRPNDGEKDTNICTTPTTLEGEGLPHWRQGVLMRG